MCCGISRAGQEEWPLSMVTEVGVYVFGSFADLDKTLARLAES